MSMKHKHRNEIHDYMQKHAGRHTYHKKHHTPHTSVDGDIPLRWSYDAFNQSVPLYPQIYNLPIAADIAVDGTGLISDDLHDFEIDEPPYLGQRDSRESQLQDKAVNIPSWLPGLQLYPNTGLVLPSEELCLFPKATSPPSVSPVPPSSSADISSVTNM